jgi:hypothetical protein
LIVSIVYFIINAFRGKIKNGLKEKDWYLQISLSKEDTVSQWFFLLSVFFLGLTLLAFNKDLGYPFSFKTILIFTSIVGLVIAYYFKVIYTLAASLMGLTVWWYIQAAEWAEGKGIKDTALFVSLLFIFIIFYLLGRAHEKEIKFKRVSIVYSILGLIPITGALFFLSKKFGLQSLEEMTKGASFFSSFEITFSLFTFLIFIVGLLIYTLSKHLVFKPEGIAIGFLVVLFSIIALLPEQTMFLTQTDYYYEISTKLSNIGIFWAIFFNILIFLELVGIIFLGYLKQENWLINLGVFFIFILIFAKYFDWFFTFLDKSIFFIGAGILLFVVGWFMEKGRRYLLSAIEKDKVSQNQ